MFTYCLGVLYLYLSLTILYFLVTMVTKLVQLGWLVLDNIHIWILKKLVRRLGRTQSTGVLIDLGSGPDIGFSKKAPSCNL